MTAGDGRRGAGRGGQPAPASAPTPLAPFRAGVFRRLWFAALVSNFGSYLHLVGAAWAMMVMTSSETMVALVQAMVTMPVMLGAVLAGVLADSFDRRLIMLTAQVFMLAVSAALAFLSFAGLVTPEWLLIFTFLIGCGTALHNPCWHSSVGDIVGREDVAAAVALNSVGMNINRSVGPAIGAVIVGLAGVAFAFAVNAASYIAMIAALLSWRRRSERRNTPRERFGGALMSGFRYFLMSPHLIMTTFRAFLFGLAGICLQALSPIVAENRLDGGVYAYGVLLGAFGLGAVAGMGAATRTRARFSAESICRAGFLLFGACCCTVAFSDWMPVVVLSYFAAGACWLNVVSLMNATVQLSTPRWVLGRILSIYLAGIFGGMTVGSYAWGVASEAHGIPLALLAAAGILIIGAAWGLLFPLPVTEARNLDPSNAFNAPAVDLALERRSGPIMIALQYRIAPQDEPEFLHIMARFGRVRKRDGARTWSLYRDLEHTDVWIEQYKLPTWTDYLRHHERRTGEDHELARQLKALSRDGTGPEVRRLIQRPAKAPSPKGVVPQHFA